MKIPTSIARVAVAIIFLSITLIVFGKGGIVLGLFLSVLIFAGTLELIKLCKLKGAEPSTPLIIFSNLAIILLASVKLYSLIPLLMSVVFILSFILVMVRGQNGKINDAAINLLCIIYGGFLPSHIIMLRNININGFELLGRNFSEGLGFLILMFVVISVSDIAAFYIGTRFGKNKLCPNVSPNKTIEGALAATIAGITGAVAIGSIMGLNIFYSAIGGLLLSVTAQVGDLCESMIKRDAGVKDSGSLLPGHGGMLDRADSYVFTGAIAYYYFTFLVLGNSTIASLF